MQRISAVKELNIFLYMNRRWEDSLVPEVCRLLADDLPLAAGAPGGMVEYRRTLTTSFFFKFYLTVLMQLQARVSINLFSTVVCWRMTFL